MPSSENGGMEVATGDLDHAWFGTRPRAGKPGDRAHVARGRLIVG